MKEFIVITLNGLTQGALYFLVATGFTLIFGLMRVVNLAHGSLYLLGAYLGWSISGATGNWFLAIIGAPLAVAIVGILLQQGLLRRIQGQDLREALVTIGVSIVAADLLLASYGGLSYVVVAPDVLNGTTNLGGFTYPTIRLVTLLIAALIGVGLWFLLCQALMGLQPIAKGDVFFEGQKLTGQKPYQIASLGIGYVPQGRRIFPLSPSMNTCNF